MYRKKENKIILDKHFFSLVFGRINIFNYKDVSGEKMFRFEDLVTSFFTHVSWIYIHSIGDLKKE